MQEMVDAAMAAAKREGMMGAVILFGPGAPKMGGTADGDPQQELEAKDRQIIDLKNELAGVREALAQAQAQAGAAPAGGVPEAQYAEMEARAEREAIRSSELEARANDLFQKLEAAQAEVERLKAASGPSSGTEPDPMPTDVRSLDDVSIEYLGLDPKVEKGVRKAGHTTVGSLRAAYMEDAAKLKKDGGLTKDGMIDIGIHLAGKLPSLTAARAQAQTAPAADMPAPAIEFPKGFTDRPWAARYNAALAKELKMREHEANEARLREMAKAAHPDAVGDGGVLDLAKLPPEVAEPIRLEMTRYHVVRGQAIAGMWHAGLNVMAGSLAAALQEAGFTPESLAAIKDAEGRPLVWPSEVGQPVGAEA